MAGRPIDIVGDERFSAGGARQKSRGEVCGLAGDSISAMALAADRTCDDLAGCDADMRGKRRRRIQLRKGSVNLHGGAHGPLGVIAVSDRRAKQSHRRVADMFVDGPAEAVDDRVDQREKAFQQRMNVFRIQLGRQARVANQITEKNRDRATVSLGRLAATFNRRRNACVGEEPATTAAIPIAAPVGMTAFGASPGSAEPQDAQKLRPSRLSNSQPVQRTNLAPLVATRRLNGSKVNRIQAIRPVF